MCNNAIDTIPPTAIVGYATDCQALSESSVGGHFIQASSSERPHVLVPKDPISRLF